MIENEEVRQGQLGQLRNHSAAKGAFDAAAVRVLTKD
jgi:hypothetical protein